VALKAIRNYPASFVNLFRYAFTGNEDTWIKTYREDGGNTGAVYLSDLERLGTDLQAEFDAAKGLCYRT
jgi:hypothetical protein